MLRRVIDALLCAHSTFRIDALATVKFTAYTSSYTLLRRRGAAQSCQFPEGGKCRHSPTFPSVDASFSGTRGTRVDGAPDRAGRAQQLHGRNCLLGQQYESGAAPDGPHRVAELPDPSTPCRTDAVVRHGAPRRQGLAGSEALGTDATAAPDKQGAAWPSSSRIKCGPSSRRRSIGCARTASIWI